METEKTRQTLGRNCGFYVTGPKMLMPKWPSGSFSSKFDPQPLKGYAEFQWTQCELKDKSWLGRYPIHSHLISSHMPSIPNPSIQNDAGTTKGRNCSLRGSSVIAMTVQNTTATVRVADLCKAVSDPLLLPLCSFTRSPLPHGTNCLISPDNCDTDRAVLNLAHIPNATE